MADDGLCAALEALAAAFNPKEFATALLSSQGRIIVDGSGHVADSVTLPLPVRTPAPRILAGSDWLTYPGTEWEEDPPGEWSIPVFKVQRPPAPPVNGTNIAAVDSATIEDWDAKYLSELATGLCAKGLRCELVTTGPGAPHLHIKVTGARDRAAGDLQDIVFASTEPDGRWRFWQLGRRAPPSTVFRQPGLPHKQVKDAHDGPHQGCRTAQGNRTGGNDNQDDRGLRRTAYRPPSVSRAASRPAVVGSEAGQRQALG